MYKIYIIIFLFLLFIPFSTAIVSKAIVDIPNERPLINAISISGTNSKSIRIRIIDKNGINDIDYVKLKIVFVEDGIEKDFRFGTEFVEMEQIEDLEIEGVYEYNFEMNEEDKEGIYRVKIEISDGEEEIEANQDFEFSTETMPVGAFLNVPGTDTNIFDFFRNVFSSIVGWFR
ncbi:hypothetical protein KY342_01815 [Candidatus Woesearchaeota archaeon]|nr:hypothetical protein [Candidatus Woesearchaeota archaeon]